MRAKCQMREGLSRDMNLAYGDAFALDRERCDRSVVGVTTGFTQVARMPS